jgi:hypothetical protein
MNRQEFEELIQNRVYTPISSVVQSATYQDVVTPEEYVKIMNFGANTSLMTRKQASGLNTSKYSVNFFSGGYISTTVSDNQPGDEMGIKEIWNSIPEGVKTTALHVASAALYVFVYSSLVAANQNWDIAFILTAGTRAVLKWALDSMAAPTTAATQKKISDYVL